MNKYHACAPFIINNDFVKYKSNKYKIENNQIMNIQTPQAFRFNNILKAHKHSDPNLYKDDTSLVESIGLKIKFIKGEKTNFKITYPEDMNLFQNIKKKVYRYGIGYDIHKIDLKSKKGLKLCGVNISHPSLIGHSDADVGYHAICDSILGSLSMKDIGYYFKNNDDKWKNVNSKIFMEFCYQALLIKKFKIINIDINFICEKPKISRYIKKMKHNISKLLYTREDRISIKATTNEKISFIGKGEGIAAESIVLIQND